jgi:NAD-dependent DNA ligase
VELSSFFSRVPNDNNLLVQWYLILSYAYYIEDESLVSDSEYDTLCVKLLDNFDKIKHHHKHLISKEDLKAGTGYALSKKDYPSIVIGAAQQLKKELNHE